MQFTVKGTRTNKPENVNAKNLLAVHSEGHTFNLFNMHAISSKSDTIIGNLGEGRKIIDATAILN